MANFTGTAQRAHSAPEMPKAHSSDSSSRYSVSRAKRPCGTYAAAQRHKKNGEPLCAPCIEARRAWWRERARITASIPPLRAKENARRAAALRRQRREDEQWRARVNAKRAERRRAEQEAARHAIDEVAIERACAGELIRLTADERLEAVRRLLARGLLRSHIAQRLHTNGSTVNALVALLHDNREEATA